MDLLVTAVFNLIVLFNPDGKTMSCYDNVTRLLSAVYTHKTSLHSPITVIVISACSAPGPVRLSLYRSIIYYSYNLLGRAVNTCALVGDPLPTPCRPCIALQKSSRNTAHTMTLLACLNSYIGCPLSGASSSRSPALPT